MTPPSAAVVTDLAPTGTLRAAINLGNPVLAQGSPDAPAGITVELAREMGKRLGLSVELVCGDAARLSFEALTSGAADVAFLAIEPVREAQLAFTAPYVLIEGVYAVPGTSDLKVPADVDRSGHRIGVKLGSAYDLFLTRTLERATVVRGDEGVDVFRARGLEAGAGIRQPVTSYVQDHPDLRLIEEPFMQIRQAVATTRDRRPETVSFLAEFVADLLGSGFVADALHRSGQPADVAAPLR